jgi:uncharacterized membrane protein
VHSLRVVLDNLESAARHDGTWMGWNLLLALVPAVLAALVFRHRGERTAAWWLGAGLFLLFLPNAPYVVTDLIHLRWSVLAAPNDAAVVTGVLPVYAVFVGLGLLSYTFCLMQLGSYLDRAGLAARRLPIELGVHLLVAVGVVLGRFTRLNSWEPVTEPHTTLERIVLTLSARWAVPAVAVLFVVVLVGHVVTRALVEPALRAARAAVASFTARAVA